MSSLNNASKSQKTHRERHQPNARSHLGLLEKRKDYRQRAKDHNEKKKTLQSLKKKALNKNPDEFYHHMINSKTVDGVHKEKDKQNVLTDEQVKLMQTQDLRYIVSKRTSEKRKIEKMKASLHMLDVANVGLGGNKHTVFVDSDSEKKNLNLADRLDTHPALLGRSFNRLRKDDLSDALLDSLDDSALDADAKKKKLKAYRLLQQRIQREKQLGVVQEKMEVKRRLQNKKENAASVLEEETPTSAPVVRWSKERKR